MTNLTSQRHIVLYADDDAEDLMLVEDAFSRYARNVELVAVRDGVEALSYLRNLGPLDQAPCLIILDINMPRVDGKEALQTIRSMDRFDAVPVVLFSTSSHSLDQSFAHQHGAGFISKPLDIRQMEQITGQFIDNCTDEIRRNIRSQLS